MAEYSLRRSVGYHLVQSYLPTMLIVAISWVSFWMDVDSVPGRTTLGVTTLLAVSSQSSGEFRKMRKLFYAHSIRRQFGKRVLKEMRVINEDSGILRNIC